MYSHSPLRYPGGKARLANFIKLVMTKNRLTDGHYVEPYAGGASVALALLYGEYVRQVHINDLDPSVYAFWHCAVHQTDALCGLIEDAKLNIEEWQEQRRIYRSDATDLLVRGFATFYLNRTNRSGIIGNGGVIGGQGQAGAWKMNARFPVAELTKRIQKVGEYRSRINVSNLDAVAMLRDVVPTLPLQSLVYLDPPYFIKGQGLYANHYQEGDHADVAAQVKKLKVPWIVSYDDHEKLRSLYQNWPAFGYGLQYSASTRHDGQEVMFFSRKLVLPAVADPLKVTDKMIGLAA